MTGDWQDEIAYLSLSSQIGMEEAIILAIRAAQVGRPRSVEDIKALQASWTADLRAEVSKRFKGKRLTNEHKLAISAGLVGNDNGKHSAGVARHYENGHPWAGKKRPEHSAFMKAAGIVPPNATGKSWKQTPITCNHCGKTGGGTNMRRYHFDNCKVLR
jgi:hypothetical protein